MIETFNLTYLGLSRFENYAQNGKDMGIKMKKNLNVLQEAIGVGFQNLDLLYTAITHSSFANEKGMSYNKNNERLEFLGDAVLELVSSDYIYHHYPDMPEGEMTKLRASLVCESSLAISARKLNLSAYLNLGKGEIQTGGGERDSILSDALEAIIGAVFLDGGLKKAREFINKNILADIEMKQSFHDSKTALQEIVQSKFTDKISYRVEKEEGPDHSKSFECSCYIGDIRFGIGQGKTKKAAEQKAAYETIALLRQDIVN